MSPRRSWKSRISKTKCSRATSRIGPRRKLLLGSLGLAALGGGLASCRYWPEQGLWNPFLAAPPPELAAHDLVQAACKGLVAAQVWDSHAHPIGSSHSGSGIDLNPRLESLLNPGGY